MSYLGAVLLTDRTTEQTVEVEERLARLFANLEDIPEIEVCELFLKRSEVSGKLQVGIEAALHDLGDIEDEGEFDWFLNRIVKEVPHITGWEPSPRLQRIPDSTKIKSLNRILPKRRK